MKCGVHNLEQISFVTINTRWCGIHDLEQKSFITITITHLGLHRRRGIHKLALPLPLDQAAVQNRNIVMAKHPQHPPQAWRAEETVFGAVVDDDVVAAADAKLAHGCVVWVTGWGVSVYVCM